MHRWIDSLSHHNQLRRLPPEQKLCFAGFLLLISLLVCPFYQVVVFVWLSVWILVYARIPLAIYAQLMSMVLGFLLLSFPALIIAISPSNQQALIAKDAWMGVNLGSFYVYLSQEGLGQSSLILTRTLATVSCLYFLLLTTPFSELLQTFRRWGMPEILTELLLLMYRFVFILLTTAAEIWTAQNSRNGYSSYQRWLHSLSRLIQQLFHKTIQNYHQFVLATKARGFNGKFQVWSSQNYQPSPRYTLEAIFGCVVILLFNFSLKC